MNKPKRIFPAFAALASLSLGLHTASAALVLQYGFEEGAGTSTADLAPVEAGNNTGSLVNGASMVTNSGAVGSFVGSFDGSNDHVNVTSPGSLLQNANGFTLAAWINATQVPSTGYDSLIFVANNESAFNRARAALQIGDGGRLAVAGRRVDGDGFARYGTATGTITAGEWFHVAASVAFSSTGATVSLYVNGALVSNTALSSSFSSGTATSNTASWNAAIGAQPNAAGEQYLGLMDDVRIYNTALDASEIAAIAIPEPGAMGLLALIPAAMCFLRPRRRLR